MSILLEQIADSGISFLEFAWVPLLVWTSLSMCVLLFLEVVKNLHVQIHYHLRLGLMFALPAGFLIAIVFHMLEPATGSAQTLSPFKFIIIPTPVELYPAGGNGVGSSAFQFVTRLTVWILITGTFLFLSKYLIQYSRLFSLSRSLQMIPLWDVDSVTKSTLSLASKSGREISVAIVSDSVLPFTFGSRRPVVIIPGFLTRQRESLNMVLKHEITHIINRDFRIHCITTGIRTLFWYNPLVHMLYHQLIEYMETRCDNHVLSDNSISRKAYASLLMGLLVPDIHQQLSMNMAHGSSNLKRRIKRMGDDNIRRLPIRKSVSVFSLIFLITVVVMACTDFKLHQLTNSETASEYLPDSPQLTAGPDVSSSENENNPATEFVADIDDGEPEFFVAVEQSPELIGGLQQLQTRIKYPETARRAHIEGTVIVQFIVNEEGFVENLTVIRSIHPVLDEEAIRVLKTARFIPGRQRGRPVNVMYSVPIIYDLADNGENGPVNTST